MNVVQQQLDKLRVPDSAVRQYAVAAVFEAIQAKVPQNVRDGAVRQCLQLRDQRALEVAVNKLAEQASSGGWNPEDALDALITSISVADQQSCGPLVRGVLSVWGISCSAGTAGSAGGGHGKGGVEAWNTHPLSRALQANPAAAQPLLLGLLGLLARSAGPACAAGTAGPTPSFQDVLQAAQPFLAFVLLSPEASQRHPGLGSELHASLARFACCAPVQHTQHAVLCLLVAALPCCMCRLPAQQGAVIAAVGDIMDILESCGQEPRAEVLAALACHLISLCYELAQHGGPMQPMLAAMHRLAAYWPEVLAAHVADVAQLAGVTGGQECAGLLALLSRQVDHAAGSQGLHPAVHALALPPLLRLLAFQQDPALKQLASHNLSKLASLKLSTACPLDGASAAPAMPPAAPATPHAASPAAPAASPAGSFAALGRWEPEGFGGLTVGRSGTAALAGEAVRQLGELWQDDERHALAWLASLQASLSSQSLASQPAGAKEQRSLSSHAEAMLCALLYHPRQGVQVAAVRTLEVAVHAVPLLGMRMLPVLVQRTQQGVEAFLSGQLQQPPASLLPMLRALPTLAQHTAVVPFVVRAIQPLLGPGAPEVLQALALRLLCLLWLRSGRGYQHLRTAILGFTAPGQKAGLELRVARAESVREICGEDPLKGVELIRVIQECLEDGAPQVQSLGLRCVSLLSEADSLDFYKAWRVVAGHFPTLPTHPKLAAAWVELLGQGVLDADVHPEVAKGIVDALWLATAHPSPQVRRQAYASLGAYSLELLESIEALPPLVDFVELLARERHPRNRAACEMLVSRALAYEHAIRRRPGTALAVGKEGGSRRVHGRPSKAGLGVGPGDSSATTHRLLSTLPKLLMGGSTSNAADVLQRMQGLPAVAVLSFYAPPPPPTTSGPGAAAAAREAAAAYRQVFTELLRQPKATQLSAAGTAGAACLPAWQRFLKRWAAALRAAGGDGGAQQAQRAAGAEPAGAAAAVMDLWAAIQPSLSDPSPLVAENAVWAAAALCAVGVQPVKDAVHVVHAELTGLAGSAQAPAAVQRAALVALASMTDSVRSVVGMPAVESLAQILGDSLLHGATQGVKATAAEGLGLACQKLQHAAASAGASSPQHQALLGMLGCLLSMLCMLCQHSGLRTADAEAAAAGAGLHLRRPLLDVRTLNDGELLRAVCTGLAHAVPAMADLGHSMLLQQLHALLLSLASRPPAGVAAQQQQQQQQQAGGAMPSACCGLLGALTSEAFRRNWLSHDDVMSSLACMLGLLGPAGAVNQESDLTSGADSSLESSASVPLDGHAVGAAAAALGALLPALLDQGCSLAGRYSPEAVLQALLALANSSASRLAHAAAAKQGAAAGIARLLAGGSAIELGSPSFKVALKMLENLALSEGDPRVRKACGSVLADLCYAFKKQHGRSVVADGSASTAAAAGGASAAAAAAAAKSLAALSNEGVMRPLVESLLDGHWAPAVEGWEEEESATLGAELSRSDVGSALRCLASAERLPALNFGALCRRLLRSFPGAAEVEEGCIRLAIAHGQVQSAQLGDLVGDLLDPSRFQQLGAPAQLLTLRGLPSLLAALPESQALSALRALCMLCPDMASSAALAGAEGAPRRPGKPALSAAAWVAALLEGLRGVLAQGHQTQRTHSVGAGAGTTANPSAATAAPIASPALRQAAQQQLLETVLARMPHPATLPVSLAGTAGTAQQGTAQQGMDAAEELECWEAAVRCFQAVPPHKLEAAFSAARLWEQHPLPSTFLAASLVASGALSPRALQAPRNLLLNGSLRGQPEEEDAVAAFVGRAAAAALPAAAQQQWLGDVLEASKACANPQGALKLACCLLACAAAADASAGPEAQLALDHVTSISCHAGIATLSYNLAALGETPEWGSSLGAALLKLAAAVSAGERSSQGADASGAGAAGTAGAGLGGTVWGQVLAAALLATQHQLPQQMWPVLAARLL